MIELEFHIPLSPESVWERLTQGTHMAKWWGEDVLLEPFKMGRFTEQWADVAGHVRSVEGSITSFQPPSRLQFDFKQEGWDKTTRVEFLLSQRDIGTRLYVQHSGWDFITDETRRNREVDAHTEKWTDLMKRFTRYCT